uniref:Uncharacterized protein n=1 Tax=Romanomermis culicivorax TaxID=13658 RepID=A0A915KRJ5_ROMCU
MLLEKEKIRKFLTNEKAALPKVLIILCLSKSILLATKNTNVLSFVSSFLEAFKNWAANSRLMRS